MMAFCIHENKWPWGNTVNVISSHAEACVQLSFEDENPGVCFLSGLSVHTDFRRKGYATRLMRFCEKLCKERGIFRVDLCSVQTDYVLEFYKKLGYSPIKEENGFIKMYKMLGRGKKMYSLLEQHNDGWWWYHPGTTFDTPEEVIECFDNMFWWDRNRPHKVFEHSIPFPQKHSICSKNFKVFEFGGLPEWTDE